jgi:CheY-like chemotaxis protein
MLVDDDEATNFLNKMVLEQNSFAREIHTFDSGESALEFLSTYKENGHCKPNLILLDINMPGMNGWEFLDRYKYLPKDHKSDTLMIMLTTSLNPDDRDKADRISDIDSFLNKPLNGNELMSVLKSLLAQ